MLKSASLGNLDPKFLTDEAQNHPVAGAMGTGAGIAANAGGVGAMLPKAASALGRVGVGAAQGAATGALAKPEDETADTGIQYGERAKGGLKGLLLGGGLSGAAEGISSTGNKAADYLMQKAVGRTKYKPGLGNSLVDEGIVGTKEQIKSQLDNKNTEALQQLAEATKGLNQPISSKAVADRIAGFGKQYSTPGGQVPENAKELTDAIREYSESVAKRGDIPSSEALGYKQVSGKMGYRNETALANLKSKLAQQENAGYGQELEKAYATQNPGQDNAVSAANDRLSAIIRGKNAINKEQSIHKSPFTLTDIAATGIGTALGGAPGTAVGYMASRAMNTPLAQSALAQALQKGAGNASQLTQPTQLQAILDAIEQKR
jgi:hypothetical protein